MKIRSAFAALALMLSAGFAQAQSIQFGAHGGLNIPMGDLANALDNRLGYTLGGHVGIYYGGGHELRPRLDYTIFDGGWHPEGNGAFTQNKIRAWTISADYLYYTENRPLGFYLTGGLGLQAWEVSPDHGASSSNTALNLSLGAGYRFNRNFSVEGRLTTGQFQTQNGQATAAQFLAMYRF